MSNKTWSLTCGVSQLPIMREDPVAIILLVRNQIIKGDIIDHPYSGFYYADNLYQPLAPAIKGQYRECGRFQLLNSPLSMERLKEHINNHLADPSDIFQNERIRQTYIDDMESGYNQHLKAVDSFEQLMNKVTAGSLPGITYMAIHEELYDQMIRLKNQQDHHHNYKAKYFTAMTDYMLADLENRVEHLKENIVQKRIKQHHALAPLINGPNLIGNSALANDFIDLFLIHEVLNENRKLWQPQAGAGGIEDEFELTIAIGEFATKKYIEHLKNK